MKRIIQFLSQRSTKVVMVAHCLPHVNVNNLNAHFLMAKMYGILQNYGLMFNSCTKYAHYFDLFSLWTNQLRVLEEI